MATTLSTTGLTPAESQFLDECRAGADCKTSSAQVQRLQKLLADEQAKQAKAIVAHQDTLKKVLSSKSPAVPVPSGATVQRQTVGGVDSLIVSTA